MSLLVETIRIHQGEVKNLAYHNQRLNRSNAELNDYTEEIDLNDHILIPNAYQRGLFKCRVLYDGPIRRIEMAPYFLRNINSLAIVYNDKINYMHKWTDRHALNSLYKQKGVCDDILIIKNGLITDSLNCNVALSQNGYWYTPKQPILKGVRRASLLSEEALIERDIPRSEIENYEEIRLFNAMIEFGDLGLSTQSIFEI